MFQKIFLLLMLSVYAISVSCVSSEPKVPMGIQPRYAALNPSRILSVPVFSIPDPSAPSKIDIAGIETSGLIPLIEENVLNAFKDQPGVNGFTFAVVKGALGKSPNLWDTMNKQISETGKKLVTREALALTTFSQDCIARKNFVEFYVFCIQPSKEWKDTLNALSAKIYNADTALLVFINDFEKREIEKKYTLRTSISVLLVDTNNGNLIWGKQVKDSLANPPSNKTFPEWSTLISSMLSEPFWAQFPGRKQKTQ